jgi:hypothetical protein
MTDQKPLIESHSGRLAIKFAKTSLLRHGVPLISEEFPSVEDFILSLTGITAPSALIDSNAMAAPEMAAARTLFDANLRDFLDTIVDASQQGEPGGSGYAGSPPSRPTSDTIQVDGTLRCASPTTERPLLALPTRGPELARAMQGLNVSASVCPMPTSPALAPS